jgi:hypothetical protein
MSCRQHWHVIAALAIALLGSWTVERWAQSGPPDDEAEQARLRPDRAIHTLGASIRPEAAFPLLGLWLDQVTNRCIDGALIFPEADSMLNRLGEMDSFDAQCRTLLAWFGQRAVADRAGHG